MAIDTYQIEVKASQFVQKERFDLAIVEYKKILKHSPKNNRIRKTIGDLYLKTGQLKDAERYFLAVVEAYIKEGQFKGAIPLYRELIKIREKDYEMHTEIATCLLKSGFPTDALIHLKTAVNMTQRLKPEIAQELQMQVIELEPDNLSERRKLPELLEAANWTDKASDEWIRFAELNRRLEKDKEAARALEQAFSLRDYWETRVEASQARLRAREPRKALEYLQKTYKDHPSEPRILAVLAAGLQEIGQEAKALQLWMQAAARFQDPDRSYFAYQEALKCGAKKEDIEEEYNNAKYAFDAKNTKLYERSWAEAKFTAEFRFVERAKLLLEYGFYERALQAIEEAEGMEKRPPIFAITAEILIQLDQEKAVEFISNFHAEDKDIVKDIQQRLFGLGIVEEDSEELIDDDLLDDELLDDDSEEVDTSQVEALFAQVEQEASLGNIAEAIRLCEDILGLDPSFEPAGLRLGELYLLPEESEASKGEDLFLSPENDIFTEENNDFDSEFSFDFLEDTKLSVSFGDEKIEDDIFIDEPDVEVSAGLKDAKMRFLVGLYTEVETMLQSSDDLEAGILLAKAQSAQGKYRAVLQQLQEKIEDAKEDNPHFLHALWEIGQAYTLGGKVRSAKRILDEIEDIDSSFRSADIQLWRTGLDLLK